MVYEQLKLSQLYWQIIGCQDPWAAVVAFKYMDPFCKCYRLPVALEFLGNEKIKNFAIYVTDLDAKYKKIEDVGSRKRGLHRQKIDADISHIISRGVYTPHLRRIKIPISLIDKCYKIINTSNISTIVSLEIVGTFYKTLNLNCKNSILCLIEIVPM